MLAENILNIEGGQGRIIGFSLTQLLTHISFKLGGLNGVYIFGSLLIFLNSCLLYYFVKHFMSLPIASLTTLLFILYPADTTKLLLIHIFQLQLSLTFVLIAFNLYAARRNMPAFIFAFCSLLTYENAFLPFLAAPLFIYEWDKKQIKRFALHIVVCLSLIFILLLLRKILGESRASEIEGIETVKKIFMSLLVGPIISLYSFINMFGDVFSSMSLIKWIFITGIILFSVWMIFSARFDFSSKVIKAHIFDASIFKITLEGYYSFYHSLKLIIASLFMLMCSYLFSFTHFPPLALYGRTTSVHLASSIAGSIFIALIINIIYLVIYKNKHLKPWFLNVLIVIFLSLLLSRGFLIQKDFTESWKEQKQFWREIVNTTADSKENTIILVQADTFREDIKFVGTYTWPIPEIYNQIFHFNPAWTSPPRVAIYENSFYGPLKSNENGIYFEPEYPFLFEFRDKVFLQDSNFIYIHYIMNKAVRIDTAILCDSIIIHSLVHDFNEKYNFEKQPVGVLLLNN
ncbi:MAG: hypothetical protein R6W78_17790 [Bacteroidales bacterium]